MAITVTQNGNFLNALVTITAGTPIPLATGPVPIKFEHLFIQMLAGGSGLGLVYQGVPPNTAPASIAAATGAPAQLAPASSTAPGGDYGLELAPNQVQDLRTFAVDGLSTSDTVLVTARLPI